MTPLDQNVRKTWMKDNLKKRTQPALALVKQTEWKRFVQTGASHRRKLSETARSPWQTPLLSEKSKLLSANKRHWGSGAGTQRPSPKLCFWKNSTEGRVAPPSPAWGWGRGGEEAQSPWLASCAGPPLSVPGQCSGGRG